MSAVSTFEVADDVSQPVTAWFNDFEPVYTGSVETARHLKDGPVSCELDATLQQQYNWWTNIIFSIL